ncbi:MAG TPA: hypothetical protein PLL71_07150 [Agriterribacter sp.]|nr:hypothetical protein [Agriterribacter sp.]HRQ52370.1 hypothetical protein [Agriterribacter sp.]
MKVFRVILFVFLALFALYVIGSYIVGKRETFLIPEGYEGALIIIANQPDGIEINQKHIVYDFTKSNVIKIKGDLVTGFSPWGYLNYYEVNSMGIRKKIKVIDDDKEHASINNNQVYVWDYYFEIGGCELQGYEKTNYETLIIGKMSSVDSLLHEKHKLVNEFACKSKPRQ